MRILPYLGNMKHSPKIHIKRPTNKSNLSYRVVVAQPRELFREAAEDKGFWSHGNTGDTQGLGQKCQVVRRAKMVRWGGLSNELSIGCKPVSVWGGAGMHQAHFTQDSALMQPNGIPLSKFKQSQGR